MPDPISLLIGLAVVLAILILVKRAGQISAEQAHKLLDDDALLIDVRSPNEFEAEHLDKAVNIPLQSLSQGVSQLKIPATRPILAYCLSGTRSAMAVRTLRANGFKNAHNLGSLHRARKITVS
mgnify:CR=1 FL=1